MGSTKGEDKGYKSFDEKDSNGGQRIHKGDGDEGGFQKPNKTAKRERGRKGRKKKGGGGEGRRGLSLEKEKSYGFSKRVLGNSE